MSLLLFFRNHVYGAVVNVFPDWGWNRTIASRMPRRTVTSRLPGRSVS